jgi:hypothetical protein
MRVVDGNELHAQIHQARDKRQIARQPASLAMTNRRLAPAAQGERSIQVGATTLIHQKLPKRRFGPE